MVTLQTASTSVSVCHCLFDIAFVFSQNAWLLCELFTVYLRWPLSAVDNVEEKKHFLCINYLHNGHKKIIIIKN